MQQHIIVRRACNMIVDRRVSVSGLTYFNPNQYISHGFSTLNSSSDYTQTNQYSIAYKNIMAKRLICISSVLLLLVSSASVLAEFSREGSSSPSEGSRRLGSQSQCQIERLKAQEPQRRVESEAGHSDYFDARNKEFDCAGVAAVRRTIRPNGLLLPQFSNAPSLVYVIKGRGISGTVVPGCPESFQSFQQQSEPEQEEQRRGDSHQQVHRIREGDVIAFPAGVAHWCHNDGESELVTIQIMDTSNTANQLDRQHRQFLLAGSKKQQRGRQQYGESESESESESEGENSGSNVLSGFSTDSLANAMGINRQLAEKLKGRNDQRGEIVQVQGKLDFVGSTSRRGRSEEGSSSSRDNGMEQAYCTMRIKENIGDHNRADIYNPNSGRITTLNSQKMPILRHLKLSAVRGSLRRNAYVAPQWKVNAHSIMYVLRGSCRCQVVNNRGQTMFNGEVRQGQILVIPQNYAQLKQATSEDFEWVSFETNDNSISSPIVGKASALKGLPEEVIMNAYRISRKEARLVKWNRGEEFGVFEPRSQQQHEGRAEA